MLGGRRVATAVLLAVFSAIGSVRPVAAQAEVPPDVEPRVPPAVGPNGEAPAAPREPRVVKLTVSPAAESVPALKYDLVFRADELTAGNAADELTAVFREYSESLTDEAKEEIDGWTRAPLADLPRLRAEQVMAEHARILTDLKAALSRRECQWPDPRNPAKPAEDIMPVLGEARDVARLLEAKTRLHVAAGQYAEAAETLRLGYALARRIGQSRTLISYLVSVALASRMNAVVREFVGGPDSLNLYWSLAGLADPFVDVCATVEEESASIYRRYPGFRDPEKRLVTVEQWLEMVIPAGEDEEGAAKPTVAQMEGQLRRMAPKARRYLLAHGRTEAELDKMPVPLVCGLYVHTMLDEQRDEWLKWFRLPYSVRKEKLRATSERIRKAAEGNIANNVFAFLQAQVLPALARTDEHVARLGREIAMLRCVEALRMHAAGHDGAFPEKLGDVKAVPVPLDPVTGEAFAYELRDGVATLSAGKAPEEQVLYEIRVRE